MTYIDRIENELKIIKAFLMAVLVVCASGFMLMAHLYVTRATDTAVAKNATADEPPPYELPLAVEQNSSWAVWITLI